MRHRRSVGGVSSERSTAPIYALISNDCLILMTLRRKSALCPTLFDFRTCIRLWHLWCPWPVLDKAAALVVQRSGELDGDHYEILSPAADALAAKYPLAATLLLRAMIDFSLKKNRVKRYRHAARYFAECTSLASAIGAFGAVETHERYSNRLKQEHGRKTSFWTLIS